MDTVIQPHSKDRWSLTEAQVSELLEKSALFGVFFNKEDRIMPLVGQ